MRYIFQGASRNYYLYRFTEVCLLRKALRPEVASLSPILEQHLDFGN
jgi:hypothetical protein